MSQQPVTPQQPSSPPAYAPPVGYAPQQLPSPSFGEPFDGASDPNDLSRPLYGASFGQAVKRFFKNFANFKGRASRSEFWWVELFIFVVQLVPAVIWIGLYYLTSSSATPLPLPFLGHANVTVGLLIPLIVALVLLVPTLSITWRRLHDANFAGPFWFLTLTSVGGIIVLIFTLLPSNPVGRRFDAAR